MDDPPNVPLGGAFFSQHIGDEQAQFILDIVVARRQLVVRITDGDKASDLGAAARRAEDLCSLRAARDFDYEAA